MENKLRPRKTKLSRIPGIPPNLTTIQEKFCQEFIRCGFNATEAYRRANPTVVTSTASTEGYRFLRNDDVTARIAELMGQDVSNLTQETVASEIASVAFNRSLKPSERQKWIEMLGKWGKLGMFVSISEHRSAPRKSSREALEAMTTDDLTKELLRRLEVHRSGSLPVGVSGGVKLREATTEGKQSLEDASGEAIPVEVGSEVGQGKESREGGVCPRPRG